VSYGAASIMRHFRGHAHPVPVRHRFPQLHGSNPQLLASGGSDCELVLTHKGGNIYVLPQNCKN